MQGEAAYGGSYGFAYRLRLTVTLLGQEPSNNRSLVRLTPDMREVVAGYEAYNFSTTSGTLTYDGNTAGISLGSYDFRGGLAGPYYFSPTNTDVWIYHNQDGTKTANFQAYHNANNLSYVTTSTVSFNYTLPTIPRFATITGRTPSTTDIGISVAVTTDVTCDMVYLSIDNGATYPYTASGDFTSTTISTTGSLPSDTTYNCYVAVKRKDSQQLTYSTPFTATTATQNNFMGFM